jgi:hypothetical protein
MSLLLICLPALAMADVFNISADRFPTRADYEAEIRRIFGPHHDLAEWRDVKARYAREGGGFLREAGMSPTGNNGPRNAALTVDGERFHRGGSRQYFLTWGDVHSGYLVHDRTSFNGIPLNLGSWTSDRHILAVAADDTTLTAQADGVTGAVLDTLSKGLISAGFGEGADAIKFVSGAAEISVAVKDRDPLATRQALADMVVSFMPVAVRGSTNILGLISEPVVQDGELKVKVTLPFRFLHTGNPRALDCGDENPRCKF